MRRDVSQLGLPEMLGLWLLFILLVQLVLSLILTLATTYQKQIATAYEAVIQVIPLPVLIVLIPFVLAAIIILFTRPDPDW